MQMKMKLINKYLMISFLLLTFACGENPFESDPIDVIEKGEIVEIISENDITLEELEATLNQVIGSSNIEFNLRGGVKVISVIYRTTDYHGNSTDASGMFVVPLESGPFPLMSLHHGTQSKRENVGSQNALSSLDALLAGALGYVAVSPDMLGLGVSTLVHPYHVADVNANTVIDFIRAVKKYANENSIQLNQQLFLAGYSQGGYTTMAVHKKMQEDLSNEFTVTASAPMAGAHDLFGTAQYIVENDEYPRPSFLSFLTYAYSEVYGWNDLTRFFKPPYHNLVPNLLNGSLTTEEIDGALPERLSELFQDSFLEAIRNDAEHVMRNALLENSLFNWAPKSPVLIVHGNADTYVPYQNAVTAKANWEANGAPSVELVTIGGGTHITAIFPAMIQTIGFFEGFRNDLLFVRNSRNN